MLEILKRKINKSNPIDLFSEILLWIIIPFGLFIFAFMKVYSMDDKRDNPDGFSNVISTLINELNKSTESIKNKLNEKKDIFDVFTSIKTHISNLFNSSRVSYLLFSITFIIFTWFIYLITTSMYFKNNLDYINIFYKKYFILAIPFLMLLTLVLFLYRTKIYNLILKANKTNKLNNVDEDNNKFKLKRVIGLLIKHWSRTFKYGIGLALLFGLSVILFKSKILMLISIIFGACIASYIVYNKKNIQQSNNQFGGSNKLGYTTIKNLFNEIISKGNGDKTIKELLETIVKNNNNTPITDLLKEIINSGKGSQTIKEIKEIFERDFDKGNNSAINADDGRGGRGKKNITIFDKIYNIRNIVEFKPIGMLYELIQSIKNIKIDMNIVIILVVELIILFYLLFPQVIGDNYHKLFNRSKTISHKESSNEDEVLREKKMKIEKAILKLKMKIPNLDWDPILKNELWKPNNENKLEEYLKRYNFKPDNEENNTIFDKFFILNNITHKAALVYIKTNAPILIKLNYENSILNNKKYNEKKIKSVVLQKEPIYTDKKSSVFVENKNRSVFNYNYSLSSWVYINNQSEKMNTSGDQFASIINYGNKPNILYNVKNNILKIITINGKSIKTIYESNNIKLQKWNHIVINYEAGVMDVFINGNLVSSSKKIIPYMKNDRITIGEDDGISGSIRDTIAFSKPLGLKQISFIYNSLKSI